MTITKTQDNETVTLALSGSLDTMTSPELFDALLPLFDGTDRVVLDFKEIRYISSAGLRVLLQGEKTAKSKGSAMMLQNVPNEVMEVFDMTGFSDILTFL